MAILFLLFALAGLILGTKYKVLVLLPATVLAALTLVAAGIATGRGLAGLLVMAFLASGCLQLGYLCGAIVRHIVIEPRASLRRLSLR